MKFSFPIKGIALCTALIFSWNQIVFAEGVLTQDYVPHSDQPVVDAASISTEPPSSIVQTATTMDFLVSNTSPLSAPAVEIAADSVLGVTSPVTGAITINSGAPYATSRTVTLNLSATSSVSRVNRMSFSTNGTTWSVAETYAASKTYTLPSGDGMKTVHVKYYDKAGNVSSAYSRSIMLDTLAPVGTVRVNGGATYISQRTVTLNLSATDRGSGLDRMSFSTNGTTWTAAEAYATTKAWTFPSGDGSKRVYAKFRDKVGKWSSIVSVAVTLDTVKPTGSININSGASYATSQTITLNLSGADSRSGISKMSFSTHGATWSVPTAYVTSKAYTLPAGDGKKTVYVKYYDRAGNESAVYSKSIILETLAPSGSVSVNSGASYINQAAVILNLSAFDAGSGLSKMSFSANNVNWSAAETYTASRSWTFASGDGNKTVYVKFQDKYGRWSTAVSATVVLDTVRPTGAISINSGAAYSTLQAVTLDLSAIDNGSGINTMSFSTDNINWTVAETYASSRIFDLTAGDDNKAVYVKYWDKAGNVSDVYSKSILLDTLPPDVVIDASTPSLIREKTLAIHYTAEGIPKTKMFSDLREGENALTVTETDAAGNQTILTWNVMVDTLAPAIVVDASTPDLINAKILTIRYTADGVAKEKTFEDLVEGENDLLISEIDAAGNQTILTWKVTVDTLAPAIVVDASTPRLVNTKTFTIDYTSDGIAKQKTFQDLGEGAQTLTITETDLAGNATTVTWNMTVDTVAFSGNLRINQGASETDSRVVVLSLEVQGDVLFLSGVRFSVDSGAHWTEWEAYQSSKILELPEGEGTKTVLCELKDLAGNVGSLSGSILYTTVPLRPVVIVTSPGVTNQELYTLTYTVNGEAHEEKWRLQPGANELLIFATNGTTPTYLSHTVTLQKPDMVLPAMPDVPVLSSSLISLTAQNGLVMKYDGNTLVAVEQLDNYTLYLPELDASQNILGGLLVFANGDRLLYQNGQPVYLLTPAGAKTVYNTDGTVAYGVDQTGNKTRFAYQLDPAGKVVSILSFEPETTTRYDGQATPVWIKRADGSQIYYENGFLTGYVDASGNSFHYEVTIRYVGHELRGYSSGLIAVQPSGVSSEMPLATFMTQADNFPSAKNTLDEDLLTTIEYDVNAKIQGTLSGKGEVLQLQNGIPVLFTNAASKTIEIQSQLDSNGNLLSLAWDAGDQVEQIFDAAGKLTGLRMSDGTLFDVSDAALDRITLKDGTVLTELVWNGQTLTGFLRTNRDGSEEVYQGSVIVERTDASGIKTTFVDYRGEREAENIVTEDGKTYRVIRFPNSEGLTQRLTELVRIDMPSGARIEFDQGKPVRYIQTKQVQLEPYEVPVLLAGRSFVPQVELKNARMRALTVDANGYIFSGEILFDDGTQYLIENNEIVKQITAGGQFLEFSATQPVVVSQPRVPPEALTEAEIAYRNEIVEKQLEYFIDGVGLDADTGLPVDNYMGSTGKPSGYSQATLVGFWAEILAAIAAGDYQTSKISQEQALQKLQSLLATYQAVQAQAGWKGLVAFFNIVKKDEPILDPLGIPTGQMRKVITYQRAFNEVGFGDVLNLALSLASTTGALKDLNLSPALGAYRDQILLSANAILAAQEPGYEFFYDVGRQAFHQVYKFTSSTNGYFPTGSYMDRVFNEFRPGMAWLAAKYPQYQGAFYTLDVTLRQYETQDGQNGTIAVPFDGGAFQMFWPLIHVDETKYPDFEAVLAFFNKWRDKIAKDLIR